MSGGASDQAGRSDRRRRLPGYGRWTSVPLPRGVRGVIRFATARSDPPGLGFPADDPAHRRRHRRPRRARHPALRVPAPRACPGADPGPARERPGAALRRGEDRPPRPARVRVDEVRERGARVPRPDRVGDDPVVGDRVGPPAARRAVSRPGRRVFVTGGSRGIGRAIALRLARDGASRVAIGYFRSDTAAEETADELRALGAEPVLVRGNVTSARVEEQVAALGPLDVLVHNAATGVIRPALETEDKHWDWTLNANARAFLALTRVAAPTMPEGSSIVAISSLGSIRVLENYTLVGTSKAALEALVRYLAVELAPRGIRVNAVSAGVVETSALEHFPNREEMLASGAGNPAGRLVTPDDVAGVVAFLSSADAEMIRGQTLVIDGGWSLPAA